MNSIIVVTICAMFITFSEADTEHPGNLGYNQFLENANDACFLMDYKNYLVRGMGLDSPQISGCAYHPRGLSEEANKTFTLWFGNSYYNGRKQCKRDATYMDNYSDIVKIIFPCVEERSSSSEDPEDRTKYLHLYGVTINEEGVKSIRCGLFEKDSIDRSMFRLAISGDSSCDGLSRILTLIFPRIPKGSKLLSLTREP